MPGNRRGAANATPVDHRAPVRCSARASPSQRLDRASTADLLCVGLFEGDELPAAWLAAAAGAGDVRAALQGADDAAPRRAGARCSSSGSASASEFDARARPRGRRPRGAAGRRFDARTIAWKCPATTRSARASRPASSTGTILAGYRFDRYKAAGDDDAPRTTASSGPDAARGGRRSRQHRDRPRRRRGREPGARPAEPAGQRRRPCLHRRACARDRRRARRDRGRGARAGRARTRGHGRARSPWPPARRRTRR